MQNKVTQKDPEKKAGTSDRGLRIPMPKQKPEDRARNFYEVALGYDEESALKGAKRCLQCPKPSCREGCPVEIDIPAFIIHIVDRRYDESIRVLKKYTNLAGVCGRVCPAEDQCELKCVLSKIGAPVNVGYLERFARIRSLRKAQSIFTCRLQQEK